MVYLKLGLKWGWVFPLLNGLLSLLTRKDSFNSFLLLWEKNPILLLVILLASYLFSSFILALWFMAQAWWRYRK